MDHMICLGKAIDDVSIFDKYLDEFPELDIVDRLYGHTSTPDGSRPTWPCWFSYPRLGDISFALNLVNHLILKDGISAMGNIMAPYIPPKLGLNLHNVNIARTRGDILGHVDDGRTCGIHIGLRNSSKSITRFTVGSQHFDYRMKEGYAYTFNSQANHRVISSDMDMRFFISYKITEISYAELVEYATKNGLLSQE